MLDMNYQNKKMKLKIIIVYFFIKINENIDLEDSDKNDFSSKCCASPKFNPVLFAIYTPSEKTLWVSIDGDGAGYLYEYDFNSNEPINVTIIPDKNNISLTAINVL